MAKKGIEIEGNGITFMLSQVSADGDMMLCIWDGQTLKFDREIPAKDMIGLLNMYRDIKDYDIQNDFINPNGRVKE